MFFCAAGLETIALVVNFKPFINFYDFLQLWFAIRHQLFEYILYELPTTFHVHTHTENYYFLKDRLDYITKILFPMLLKLIETNSDNLFNNQNDLPCSPVFSDF